MSKLKSEDFEDIEAFDEAMNRLELVADGSHYEALFSIGLSQVQRLTQERDGLLVAAKAILEWGRDHTTPTEMNSPHHLLIALKAAIDKIEPPPLAIGGRIKVEDLRLKLADSRDYIPLYDDVGLIVAFVTVDGEDPQPMRFAREIAKLKRR